MIELSEDSEGAMQGAVSLSEALPTLHRKNESEELPELQPLLDPQSTKGQDELLSALGWKM